MKRILTFAILSIFLYNSNIVKSQVYFETEGFESGGPSLPSGWEEIYVDGVASWGYQDGGYYAGGEYHPESAYEGNYNAYFRYATTYITKLVTPPIDVSGATKPALVFYHAMQPYGPFNDELRIYYRKQETANWIELEEYTTIVQEWTERIIYLPDSILTETAQIAFEAKSKAGAGVCIDNVSVEERGLVSKTIKSVSVETASTEVIPTGSKNNPVLRIDFDVEGNNGSLLVENLDVNSLNTDDDDIDSVKIYYTDNNTLFEATEILAKGVLNEGKVNFSGINKDLPYGVSSIWVCYDIKTDINHEMHNHIADAMIKTNSISISGTSYPFVDKSPEGERVIVESIFFDDFETDKSWEFHGEFEWGIPQGLGSEGLFTADPTTGKSGQYIIGTDLAGSGLFPGDYEPYITNKSDSAVSPIFHAKYYKDVKLSFYRWLNMDGFDVASIDVSNDGGSSWNNIWNNGGSLVYDDSWYLQTYNISSLANRKENIRVRFSLDESDATVEAGGWNVDDIAITGDYITSDVGIVDWLSPEGGCGYTNEEQITVTIRNYAGIAINKKIPLSFSLNGGTTIYRDTTPVISIPIEGTYNYTLSNLVDLSTPGWYNNIYVTTNLSGDEDLTNNKLNKKLFIAPTYTLPILQTFETNYGYWTSHGTNSSWEYGKPTGTKINNAYSGVNTWITNLNGVYGNLEDSYLESPCFNTAGIEMPMVQFWMKSECEPDNDGLALYYSIDDGENWNIVPKDDPYDWNWYNNNNISALGHEGWDTSFTSWTKVKQILPVDVINQSQVKLRFVLKSNDNAEYEGFAIDDFKFFDAPNDVGVSSIIYPYTECEWSDTTSVHVYVENYGPTIVESGSKIPISMKFKSETFTDTVTLTQDLNPSDTVLFIFSDKVDMSYAGDYNFEIFTKFESDQFFYNDTLSNDSLKTTISVIGMPRYNPFPPLIGDVDATLTLDAGAGYTAYEWQDASDLQTYDVSAEGTYYVTVTNGFGCTASDFVEVVASETDLKIDSLYTEVADSCERNALTEISIHFINLNINSNPIYVDDIIAFGYQINNLPVVCDTLIMTEQVAFEDTIWFTFNEKCDFTEPGEYDFKVFTNILKDLDHSNDTIKTKFNTWGYVDIELAYDTIYSSQADTLLLIATPPDYDTYTWNTGATNDTITPYNYSYEYIITADDDNICLTDSDTTYIETHDLGVTAINSPLNLCEDLTSTNTNLTIEVTNFSENVYGAAETIKVYYNYDNAGWVETNPLLTGGLAASGVIELTIAQVNTTAFGEHTLSVYTSSDIDANHSNDTLDLTFNIYPNPDVELAFDTIRTTQADTIILVAQDGFDTYTWNGVTTNNDTLYITSNTTKFYTVEVEDVNGCGSDKDSTFVLTHNLGITTLVSPESECGNTNDETVTITLKNFGVDNIQSGTIIPITYILNGGTPVAEDYMLLTDLNASDEMNISFTQGADVSQVGTQYTFKTYISYPLDVKQTNDTLVEAIKTFGVPSVEIGEDIYTTQADTVSIIASPGFISYFWNDDDGDVNDTLNVSYPATKEYTVMAVDINGCKAYDSLTVYTYNVAGDSINSPIAQCTPGASETLIIGVTNYGADTLLTGEQVEVGYRLNSGSYVSELHTLSSDLYPDETELFTMGSTVDISENINHEFKVYAKLTNIDVTDKDTTTIYIDNLTPDLELGDPYVAGGSSYEIIVPGTYNSYLWFDNTTDPTYTVDINDQNTGFYYAVTVTNEYGCEGSDSLMVTFTIQPDLSVVQLYTPEEECWQSDKDYTVSLQLINDGNLDLSAGTNVAVCYKLNELDIVTEDLVLSSPMNIDDTQDYTFTQLLNFDHGGINALKTFVKLVNYGNTANDTLTSNLDMAAPDVTLGVDDTVYFAGSYTITMTETYPDYLWSTSETTASITITNTGLYSVTVTDIDGCQGYGEIYCIDLNSTNDLIMGNDYTISYYPNPASDYLNIEISNQYSKDVKIELINVQGQIIYNYKLTGIQNTIEEINISEFAQGVYYIRFNIDDEFYIRKLIIQ